MGQAPRHQPYLEVPPAPFRWRLGLRPLDLDDWLDVDERYEADTAAKAAIMEHHADTAFRVLEGVESESAEVLEAIVDHLSTHHPERFTGTSIDRTLHPLDAAGRLVQEDLVLLVERGGRLVCGGGSVCFPNRWDLTSKVGQSMAAIHAPVPQLNEQLEQPIDRFLDRLSPDRSYWRLGWGVLDRDELFQPFEQARRTRAEPSAHHLRVERETLRRLPGTRGVLFTIRTFVSPLGDLSAAGDASTLAAAIDALPCDVAGYKELDGVRGELSSWLRQLATTMVQ